MRYIWDQADEYLGKLTFFAWPLIKYLRNWDLKGSKKVAKFIPISQFVSARIRKFYNRRDSEVIYPPTDISWVKQVEINNQGKAEKGLAFLCFGALVPYKRVDHAILACINLNQELWVVGDGPDRERLLKLANNNQNVKFFGKISDQELATLYCKCRALLFSGTEDFGMVPIECMASGRPIIASYTGGAKETMNTFVDYKKIDVKSKIFKTTTGVFFNPRGCTNKVELLISAIKFFIEQENSFLPKDCIEQAHLFSVERFFESWKDMERRALHAELSRSTARLLESA